MKFSYSQERILNEWEVQSLVPIQRGFSLFDGDLAKLNLINKSTTISFYGLYSYRPQKWHQNVQNLSGTHQPQVSGFTAKLTVYNVHLRWNFSKKRENKWASSEFKNHHFQIEAKCTTFLVKMSFICMRMKNHFHIKGWALNLVLKQRPGGTRKWPIAVPLRYLHGLYSYWT